MKITTLDYVAIFDYLTEWKTISDISKELEIPSNDVWRAIQKLIQHGNVIDKYINPTIANNQCKTAFMQSKTGTYESIMKIVQPPKGQPRKIKPIEQSNQPTQKEKVSEWLLCVLTNEPISTDDIVNQSQYEANLIDQALKDLCNKGLIEHLLLSQNKYTDYVDCYRKADQAALKISFTTDDMVKKIKEQNKSTSKERTREKVDVGCSANII